MSQEAFKDSYETIIWTVQRIVEVRKCLEDALRIKDETCKASVGLGLAKLLTTEAILGGAVATWREEYDLQKGR